MSLAFEEKDNGGDGKVVPEGVTELHILEAILQANGVGMKTPRARGRGREKRKTGSRSHSVVEQLDEIPVAEIFASLRIRSTHKTRVV